MDNERLVLIVESDQAALAQMKSVLAGMGAGVVDASGLDEACAIAGELASAGKPPELIVARVTLPDGSGVQVLEEMAELFPHAHRVVISHFPVRLLYSLPGFASLRAEFLQAAFTDDQFRKVVRHALEHSISS
jgi:DNA-binding NtrC family response regulator